MTSLLIRKSKLGTYLLLLTVTMSCVMAAALSGRALIVQNKGGGHGSIGFHLCKDLRKCHPNLEVVLLQDQCNRAKPPFSSYTDLEAMGVTVLETKLSSADGVSVPAALSGMKIDYVVDNWSKSEADASFVVNIAKQGQASQYLFISSAGMYKGGGVMPMLETDPVKSNNGARTVEVAVEASGVPFTFLRPQYIYGPQSSKRYLDYFIGRAFRKLHIPLPMSGEQLLSLTHVEDVASLISTALGNPKAMNQVFNCGTDRYVTYKGLCQMVHAALGNAPEDCKHLYYEPKLFDKWDGTEIMEFPFRRETFVVAPTKAKLQLGWQPKHRLQEDLDAEVADYTARGATAEKWGLEQLKYDLEIIASKDQNFMFTYPMFDDAAINPESRPYHFESAP